MKIHLTVPAGSDETLISHVLNNVKAIIENDRAMYLRAAPIMHKVKDAARNTGRIEACNALLAQLERIVIGN